MDVERCRLAAVGRFLKCAVDHSVRKLAEVATAGRRHGISKNAGCRQRKFGEATMLSLDDVGHTSRGWISISASANRKEARVIAVAFIDQNIKGPLTSWNDREVRRAIADNRRPDQIFERRFGRTDILAKGSPIERRNALVPEAVRTD